jgi:hypothetical protein
MKVPLWILGASGLGLALVALRKRSKHAPVAPVDIPKKAESVAATWAQLGYGPFWQSWGIWVALGESGWNINAHNDSASERGYADTAWESYVGQGRWPESCPRRTDVGSGGWYGMLYPYTVMRLVQYGAPSALFCKPIHAWRNPQASTIAHILLVQSVLDAARKQSNTGQVTPLQLRAKYGAFSRNVNKVDTPKRRKLYTKSVKKAGLPASFLDTPIPELPYPPSGIL